MSRSTFIQADNYFISTSPAGVKSLESITKKKEPEKYFLPEKSPAGQNDKPVKAPKPNDKPKEYCTWVPVPLRRMFWYMVALLPTFVSSFLISVYLNEYMNTSWYLSFILGLGYGIIINLVILFSTFLFTVFTLTVPEFFGRVLRIYIVQTALQFSPLSQIQLNLKTFMNAYTCTFSLAIEASQDSSKRLIQSSIEAGRRLVTSISSVSDDIERLIDVPLKAVQIPFNAIKDWLRTVRNFQGDCSRSINQAYDACNSAIPDFESLCRRHIRGKRSPIWDSIGNVFKDVGNHVSNAVNTGVHHTTNAVNTGVHHTTNAVNTGVHHTTNAVNTGVRETINGINTAHDAVVDTIHKVCSGLDHVNPCGVLKIDICSTFGHVSNAPGAGLDLLKEQLDKATSVFSFNLRFNSNYNSKFSNDTVQDLKQELNSVLDEFQPYVFCKTLFNYLIIVSFVYILLSKIVLVLKYRRGRPIQCGGISKLCLITNPMTVQLIALTVMLIIDLSLRNIYNLQQTVFQSSSFQASTEYNANIGRSGGTVGRLIAEAMSKSFGVSNSQQKSFQIGKCYEPDLEAPSYEQYAYVLTGLIIAFSTYIIDIKCRKNQGNLITHAENVLQLIRSGGRVLKKRSGSVNL